MIKGINTTGIGSLPHRDAAEACRVVIDGFDIPFCPQLPNLSFLEYMIPQYSEGMPFIRYDKKAGTAYVERDSSDALKVFYERYSDDYIEPITPDFSAGLPEFIARVKDMGVETLKGHITGPLTFTLGLKDREGRYIYYDEELREVALMLLKAKVRFQVKEFLRYAREVIIFVDEPIFSAIGGSGYLGVSREETARLLDEIFRTINEAGAISAIHCCGKADWEMVIEAGPDILNFDAYAYFDTFIMYREYIKKFVSSGGILAFGIVPTTNDITKEAIETIETLFYRRIDELSAHLDIGEVLRGFILTPSCGAGSLSESDALKVIAILKDLKTRVKDRYGVRLV